MPDARDALRIARPQARKLARQGRLVDETFKLFQRTVYPGALPDQVAALRIAFFAGAQEIFLLSLAGLGDEDEPTHDELEFMSQWTSEIERFHQRTIAAAASDTGEPAN